MKYIIFLLVAFSANLSAQELEISEIFSEYPIEGSIVVTSLKTSKRFVFNEHRARSEFTVASTFKIPNTLIALQENIVSSESDSFEWDGKKHDIASWNRDQTLASAFKVSCVWCYQKIAKTVGRDRYQKYLSTMSYGSLPSSFDIENFWLDGSLKLSAFEQIEFLKKLYRKDLPFDDHVFDTAKGIMLVESTSLYSLYAKTGWAPYDKEPVGWYVGYVDTGSDVWFFATNLEVRNSSDLHLRESITRRVLKAIGALPDV